MNIQVGISIHTDAGNKFFGQGPYCLLRGIQQFGSLRASAQSLGMSYTKAFQILRHAEMYCGFPLTQCKIGGEGGGGSILTVKGEELLLRYESFQSSCTRMVGELYQKHFSDFWPQEPSIDRLQKMR